MKTGLEIFYLYIIGEGKGNQQKQTNAAKAYKRCRKTKCSEQCGQNQKLSLGCTNCAAVNGCQMPKGKCQIFLKFHNIEIIPHGFKIYSA